MTRSEWIELLLIAAAATGSGLVRPLLPAMLPLWQIVLYASALLLAQSLVRDIAILIRSRQPSSNEPRREAQCFCLESTVGATGIVAGAALAGLGSSMPVAISRWDFVLSIAGILALGFLIKDLVISWRPFGIRREKGHLNLIVRWKRKSGQPRV
jgi:hypothetical protein